MVKCLINNFKVICDESVSGKIPMQIRHDKEEDGSKDAKSIDIKSKDIKSIDMKSWFFPSQPFDPWPEKTSICCWWCTYEFSHSPFPLPVSYNKYEKRFRTRGIFCGPSCAKAYAANSEFISNVDAVFRWIEMIAHDYYGYKLEQVVVAPPKEILQKYCGPSGLTIEKYRAIIAQGHTLRILPPNWTTVKQVVQAEQNNAKKSGGIFHKDDPDQIQRISDLVTKKRIPYAGLGIRTMDAYRKNVLKI